MNQKFSFYIITEADLGIQCAEIILANNHQVLGVISTNQVVIKWAFERKILCFHTLKEFENIKPVKAFDYLLSVINNQILPPVLLEYPRYCAINYHDSLLPKYAGVHATSWSILNRESYHGVTWHIMEPLVDAGDILKQVAFPIEKNETSLTLNLKCYAQALKSFKELVKDISEGSIYRRSQNLQERSYYGAYQKPNNVGIVDWNTTAQDVDRLYRALYFGNYPNELVAFKVLIGDQVFFPHKVEILKEKTENRPGIIVNVDQNSIQITTKTEDILIKEITDIQGNTRTVSDLTNYFNLCKGYRLTTIAKKIKMDLYQKLTTVSVYESHWIKTLSHSAPTKFLTDLFLKWNKSAEILEKNNRKYHYIDDEIETKIVKESYIKFKGVPLVDILCTVFTIYIYRLGNKDIFSVQYTDFHLKQFTEYLGSFLSTTVPLKVDLSLSLSGKKTLEKFIEEKNKIKQYKTYSLDIRERIPLLKKLPYDKHDIKFNIVNTKVGRKNFQSAERDCLLEIDMDKEGDKYSLVFLAEFAKEEKQLIEAIPGHIRTLLKNLVKDPECSIEELSFLTPEEEEQILIKWNDTKVNYVSSRTIYQLFEEQVKKTPDNIAVIYEDQELTYQQLNETANQLAHYLRSLGVTSDTFVAIAVESSLEMVIGLLGVLKAGGAYVPLDPNYPQERLQFILEDTNAPIIITNTLMLDKLPTTWARTVCLDKEWNHIKTLSTSDLTSFILPRHLAYVIYTSGSTGKPKGVLVDHGNLCNLIDSMKQIDSLASSQYFLQNVSFSFDPSLWTTLWPLIQGASVILLSTEHTHNPTAILGCIQQYSLSLLHAGPALLRALLAHAEAVNNKSLKHIIGGGEKWLIEDLRTLRETLPNCNLTNVYGPTESTIHVLTWTFKDSEIPSLVPIGRPISNTQIYILDAYMKPVPIRVVGELYIGGDGLARGYLNRPDLTAEKFVPNPFIKEEDLLQAKNLRLYRTGDLARYLPDGNIEFIGRSDDQVKIRGFRIELGEIEANLLQHPDVNQTVVMVREDQPDLKQLVAYIVPKAEILDSLNQETVLLSSDQQSFTVLKGEKISALTEDLRNHLVRVLPDYMVPSFFVFIDKIPLNPNGKIDRKSLPPPEVTNIDGYVAPRNELETKICQAWAELLGIPEDKIGIHDDFFKLGGNSLLVIRLANKLNTIVRPHQFSIISLFKYSKINDFVQHLLSNLQNERVEYEL